MRPTLRQLEYLVGLSEKLNFRQCAQDMNVTQPTLSGQIKELEEKLGVELFERTNKMVRLTPIGEKLTEKARIILQDVDYFCDAATIAGKSLGGVIHLGVPPSLGPYILPYIIPLIHKEYPDLRLHIIEAPPRELEIGLDQGKYDLLFTATPTIMAELSYMTLFDEPLLVGMSTENELSKLTKIEGHHLKGQKVITLGLGHQLFEQAQVIASQYDCQILSEYEGTSLDAVRHMVAMNMGLSFFPGLYAASEIKDSKEIKVLPFFKKSFKRSVGLAWRRTSPRIKDYHLIAQIINQELKERFADIIA